MATKEFDTKFQELYTKLVDLAFEYVNRNKEEVDVVYVYVDMEGSFFYNVFYKINGHVVGNHQVNLFSKIQYDISRQRQSKVLGSGGEYVRLVSQLFKDDGREIPTRMKLIYFPKTGAFNNDISYKKEHNYEKLRGNVEVLDEWFVEMGGAL